MAELISESQPRIKFNAEREGPLELPVDCTALTDLAALMAELEQHGLTPVLNDGLVAGNCAIAASCVSSGAGSSATLDSLYVSRSGKRPGAPMSAADWVLVTLFDSASWSARYCSVSQEARPTSDTPLHMAALASGAQQRFGWGEAPGVAVHGHALAEGAGLQLAEQLAFPISHEATLFSTPEDRQQLQRLFAAHPYPQHRCYIRRGHGFFLLGRDVEDCRRSFRQLILPHLQGPGSLAQA